MPRAELMTWISSQKRWTKLYMGKRYYVSCRQLRCPPNKVDSVAAANEWWRTKQTDLDHAEKINRQQSARTPQPREDVAAALFGSEPWTTVDAIIDHVRSSLQKAPPADIPPELAEQVRQSEITPEKAEQYAEFLRDVLVPAMYHKMLVDGVQLPPELAGRLPPARVAAIQRGMKELNGECASEPGRTVKEMADSWLLSQKYQVDIKGITPARYHVIAHSLAHFVEFIGDAADVAAIDAPQLEGFHNHCVGRIGEGKWSAVYSRMIFGTARQWIDWLAGRGSIPYPTNFHRRFRFGPTAKKIVVWGAEEVCRAVNGAKGKLRLCLLLCLNCGMTAKDVSDLADHEVNWQSGRVRRKRSKTRDRADTPEVNYPLWPSTFRLLREHRSGGERVIVTKSGEPYVNKRLVDGKLREYDGFGTLIRRLTKRLGIKKPLKALRKTSASMLESHEVYGRFTSLFLGHSPRSMKDRHYAAPPQELFDAAIVWLGERLGVAE